MRYIEIQDGISLNISCIEGIEKIDENKCKIYTNYHTYLATFPYDTLLGMIKQDEIIDKKKSSEEIMKSTMQKVEQVLGKSQHWAG